jgi:hypothetical protein
MVTARHLMASSIVRGIRAAEMGGVLNVARQLVVTARRVYIGHQPASERKNRPSRIELRGEARAVDGEKWAIA